MSRPLPLASFSLDDLATATLYAPVPLFDDPHAIERRVRDAGLLHHRIIFDLRPEARWALQLYLQFSDDAGFGDDVGLRLVFFDEDARAAFVAALRDGAQLRSGRALPVRREPSFASAYDARVAAFHGAERTLAGSVAAAGAAGATARRLPRTSPTTSRRASASASTPTAARGGAEPYIDADERAARDAEAVAEFGERCMERLTASLAAMNQRDLEARAAGHLEKGSSRRPRSTDASPRCPSSGTAGARATRCGRASAREMPHIYLRPDGPAFLTRARRGDPRGSRAKEQDPRRKAEQAAVLKRWPASTGRRGRGARAGVGARGHAPAEKGAGLCAIGRAVRVTPYSSVPPDVVRLVAARLRERRVSRADAQDKDGGAFTEVEVRGALRSVGLDKYFACAPLLHARISLGRARRLRRARRRLFSARERGGERGGADADGRAARRRAESAPRPVRAEARRIKTGGPQTGGDEDAAPGGGSGAQLEPAPAADEYFVRQGRSAGRPRRACAGSLATPPCAPTRLARRLVHAGVLRSMGELGTSLRRTRRREATSGAAGRTTLCPRATLRSSCGRRSRAPAGSALGDDDDAAAARDLSAPDKA